MPSETNVRLRMLVEAVDKAGTVLSGVTQKVSVQADLLLVEVLDHGYRTLWGRSGRCARPASASPLNLMPSSETHDTQ